MEKGGWGLQGSKRPRSSWDLREEMLSLPLDCKAVMSGKAAAIFENINTVFEWEIYALGFSFPEYKMGYSEKQVSLVPCPCPSAVQFYFPEAVTVTCYWSIFFQRFFHAYTCKCILFHPPLTPPKCSSTLLSILQLPGFYLRRYLGDFSTSVHRGLPLTAA